MPRATPRSSSSDSAISRFARSRPAFASAVGAQRLLEPAEVEREGDQPLLGAVVKVALQSLPLLLAGLDEPSARSFQLFETRSGKVLCMGYATFRERCDDTFAPWRERLRRELAEESAEARLRDAQHLLCELVETLDVRRVRYTRDLRRA
jgi:hypothetical protein